MSITSPTTSSRLAASFVSALVGWAAAVALYVVFQIASNESRIDVLIGAVFAGAFVVAAWALAVAPLAALLARQHVLCSRWIAPIFGAACGLLLYPALMLLRFGQFDARYFGWFGSMAAVAGCTTWALYAGWLRRWRPGSDIVVAVTR